MKKIYLLLFLLMPLASVAQELSVKTNALYWATGTMNLGMEVGLGKRVTFDVSGNYNPFQFKDDTYLKFWSVNPEFRFWFGEKFYGHFLGLGAVYGEYNMSGIAYPGYSWAKDSRYEGWIVSVGITYGYQWPIAKRWNMEAFAGVGFMSTGYDKYEKGECGKFIASDCEHIPFPTKLGLSFIYLIR